MPRPHQPYPATTTVRPASMMLVARMIPSMVDWPVPYVLSSMSLVPVASAALQMFLMAAAAGMGGDDDASIARVYARITGVPLPGNLK